MTQKTWEKALLKQLNHLPRVERNAAIEYYREIYGDKLDAGYSEKEILQEFGSPEACAKRILSDDSNEFSERERIHAPSISKNHSIAGIIGLVFLTLILILPLASVALSLVVAFAAVSISGIVVALSGVILTIGSPFLAFIGTTLPAVISGMGMGICAIGIGAILFSAFFFGAKYLAIWSYKALKFIYVRRI